MKYVYLVIVVLLSAPSSTASGQASDETPNVGALRPGDAVRITVWQKPELSGEFYVSANGGIAHPYYQDVQVGGIAVPTIYQRVHAHLAQYDTNPIVLVEPLIQVAVAGEVRRPDVYLLPPETTITQAIMRAGGPTEHGRMNRVRIVRADGDLTLDLNRPDAAISRTYVQSGDQILMTRSRNVFRDYVGPVASVAGLTLAVVRIFYYAR